MNAKTTAAIAALTAKGQATMLAVGKLEGISFFDEGVNEGSGCWGFCFTNDLGHKSSGVANQLAKLGLFDKSYDEEQGDTWFALTALGADVANALAAEDADIAENAAEGETRVADDEDLIGAPAAPAPVAAAPGVTTMKVCGKWTRFILDGVEVGRIRNDVVGDAFVLMQG